MKDPDIEDLIGGGPTGEDAFTEAATGDTREVAGGVSVTWLMQTFRMDRQTIKKRLAQCPVLRQGRGNTPLFDLPTAASYLVAPRVDIGKYLKSLRTQDLPVHLQAEYWDAMNKRLKWQRAAGELWATPDVLDVFAEAFKTIKQTMQLWPDTIDRAQGITNDHRRALTGLIDSLQDELHKKLVEIPKQRETRSVVKEIDEPEEAAPEEDLV